MRFLFRRVAGLAALVVILVLAWSCRRQPQSGQQPSAGATAAASTAAKPAPPPTTSQTATIARHSNFVAAMAPFHLDAGLVQTLIQAAHPIYNLANVRAGRTLTLVRSSTGAPEALSYPISQNQTLWIRAQPAAPASPAAGGPAAAAPAAAPAPAAAWKASIETIPYETRVAEVSGLVTSSLFQAIEDAGEHDQLGIDMSQIFGWDLDFNTDTQPGDVFRVIVNKRYLSGKFAGYGQILAAEYVNSGEHYDAVRFHDAQGELAYYRPDGKPMKREFLRSPLRFEPNPRITSGFSRRRYHPILKIYRAHLGIDYHAPMGSAVQTIGDGVVVRAGRKGEDGRMVEIRHPNGYYTFYLHLLKILVHVGEHVHQGQIIAHSGMSGLATGPHLDFRIERNGRFENFNLFRKTLPPGAPVKAKLMPQFKALVARYMPELAKLKPQKPVNSGQ